MYAKHSHHRVCRPVFFWTTRTRHGLDTPRDNQQGASRVSASDELVEITDASHPLYLRSFELLSITPGVLGTGFVTVRYRDNVAIRIPLPATNLSDFVHDAPRSKLTAEAVRDLLALAKEYESCLTRPRKSGKTSRRKSGKKSSKK